MLRRSADGWEIPVLAQTLHGARRHAQWGEDAMTAVIAVVDDDLSILGLIQSVLTEAGYAVVVRSEGQHAYEFVRDQHPDLLILDLRMEHRHAGWIILHMLRLNPETAGVPILVCTGDVVYVQMRRQLLREEQCALLLKPFSVDDLLDIVAELLHGNPT